MAASRRGTGIKLAAARACESGKVKAQAGPQSMRGSNPPCVHDHKRSALRPTRHLESRIEQKRCLQSPWRGPNPPFPSNRPKWASPPPPPPPPRGQLITRQVTQWYSERTIFSISYFQQHPESSEGPDAGLRDSAIEAH